MSGGEDPHYASGLEFSAAQIPVDRVGDALFRPVRTGNAFEETVSRLLQTIRLGIVSPGTALPSERELATLFVVSRDTVRDAIKSLSDAGFLVARRGRYGGTFVVHSIPSSSDVSTVFAAATLTTEHIEDALTLREILEVGAARSAASRSLSSTERGLLWNRLSETALADAGDYRRLDSRLHLTIGEMVGAPSLVPLLADNRMRLNELLERIPLLPPNIEHSNEQHESIVVAILTGDADQAARSMLEHLQGTATLLRGFLID